MLICDVFQIKISTQNDTALHFMMGSSLHNVCAQVVLTRVTQRTGTNTYVRVDVAECCLTAF